jgi:hypothetical protein
MVRVAKSATARLKYGDFLSCVAQPRCDAVDGGGKGVIQLAITNPGTLAPQQIHLDQAHVSPAGEKSGIKSRTAWVRHEVRAST